MNERERAIEARVNDGYELWFDAFDNCCQIDQQVYIDMSYLLARVAALEAALTPFAEVGAAVAALRDVRPQSSYAPEHAALTIGGATVTFAHLIAAANVLAVRAEAVTGGESSKGGISEHGEKAT